MVVASFSNSSHFMDSKLLCIRTLESRCEHRDSDSSSLSFRRSISSSRSSSCGCNQEIILFFFSVTDTTVKLTSLINCNAIDNARENAEKGRIGATRRKNITHVPVPSKGKDTTSFSFKNTRERRFQTPDCTCRAH